MAQPKTASWTKMLIQVGDGAQAETFTAPCALVSKGLNLTTDTSDSTVPDCDDPDAPSWVERVARSLSGEVSGSGRLALDSHATWRAWFLSGKPRNCRVKIAVPLADGGGHYAGRFLLTSLALAGNEGDGKIGVEVKLASDGPVAWVPASA